MTKIKKPRTSAFEMGILDFSKRRYTVYVTVLLVLSMPLLYFFVPYFPWETNRLNVVLVIIGLLIYGAVSRILLSQRFAKGIIFSEIFITALAGGFIAFYSGGILSPFNILYVIPIAYATFLMGKRWGYILWIFSLGILTSFLVLPAGLDIGIIPRFSLFLAYGIVLTYTSYILIFLSGVLLRIEEARKKAKKRVSYLEKIQNRLEALNRIKTEFVERTSHQLRTPLNRMRWGMNYLAEEEAGPLSDPQKKFVLEMQKSTEQLLNLTSQLLEVSNLERGKAIYKKEKIALLPIIEKLIAEYKNPIKIKNLSVEVEKKELPLVEGDAEPLMLVFRNIIDNAILYNKPGGKVTISFKADEKRLVTKVRDTGIGIPEKEKSFIFQRFYRAKNAARYVADGTGLGLSLSKDVIEHMNGEISIKSKEGEWTEVTVALPLA